MGLLERFEMTLNHALVLVFGLGIMVGFGAGMLSPVEISLDSHQAETGQTEEIRTFDTEGNPTLGSEDAEVTMVMFEDYQCPFCGRFETTAYPQIVDEYVESGDLEIVWMDYPLDRHPWAMAAAEINRCIHEEDGDAFWTVKDRVYENQDSMDRSNVEDRMLSWAEDEGVDREAVASCYANDEMVDDIEDDIRQGGQLGTPTVYINGQEIVGAQPFQNYQSVIEEELNS